MTAIRVKLFGGFEARFADGRQLRFGTRKSEALLAFLAFHPGTPHSRDRLAAMFWGDGSDQTARHSLRQALAGLRRAFNEEAPLLQADRDTVALRAAGIDVDVASFEESYATENAATLEAAALLYRGPLLDGFHVPEESFGDWLAQERARLHDRAVLLLLRLSELAPDGKIATAALLRVLELDPSCEEAHRRLMRAHIADANFNAAIRQYNACVEALRRELAATPEPRTMALHQEALAARARGTPPLHSQAPADVDVGERKVVTVLCVAFTSPSPADGLGDPERAQAALGPVLQEMRTIALRDGGSVIGETSDELIIIFGAPVACENHAASACRAASDMMTAVAGHAGFPFRPNIGIDSGEVVVRTRDRSLMPAGVFGHCLRRAAWLARAGHSTIGATEATVSLANRFWRFAPGASVLLENLGSPVNLYVPIGPWPGLSGLDHFPAHLLSRFIGRRDELAAITAALAPAAAGHGQIIAVVGEPGIGKSRLLHEFVRSVPDNWRVIACRGDPQLADVPYLPIANAIRGCLGIGREQSRAQLVRVLRALDPTLEQWLPALCSLLDVEISEPDWHALEPAQKGQQIVTAVTMVLGHRANVQPLVLIVEDLHWLDPASRNVLARLVDVLPTARIVLAVNYRPDFLHDWGRRSYYRQIAMSPLSAATTAEFVDALLGNDVSMESLRARLIQNTGGNPFFIEECVRSLAHCGTIAGERGAYRAEHDLQSLELPETVQAVLAARIDQLALTDRTLLHVAAVIGNEVPYGLLRAVVNLDEESLRAALRRLAVSEFLIEMTFASNGPNASYRFKHALTNEVAYNTLLQQTRRELHARILTVLENEYAGRQDEQIEALAYHSSRGDVFERAAEYGHRAGLKALARAAYRAAIAHFEQAVSALGRLAETPTRIAQEIDLRFAIRNALFVLGEHDRILEHLRRAEALAEQTNDALRQGYAALHIGAWFWYDGRQRLSLDAGERVLAIAQQINNRDLTALAWYRIGQSHHAGGDYRAAIDAFLRCTSMLEQAGHMDLDGFGGYPYAFCCSFLSQSFAELGIFSSARDWGLRGWQFATDRNHIYTQSVASFGLGLCYLREGSFNEARLILEKGLRLHQAGDAAVVFSWGASPLGYVYVALGQRERGLELLGRAAAVKQPNLHRARRELFMADACLLAGLRDEAFDAAQRGIALAEKNGERAQVAWAERVLGDLASTRDPIAADRHYARAIEIARPLEHRADLRAALLGSSRLLLAQGRAIEAQALTNEATSLAAFSSGSTKDSLML